VRIVRCKDGEQLVRVAQIDEPEEDETPADADESSPVGGASPPRPEADEGAGSDDTNNTNDTNDDA
jgi:hypothetical protein